MISGLKMTYLHVVSDQVLQRRRVRLLTAWMRLFDSAAEQEGKTRRVNVVWLFHSRGEKTQTNRRVK